jgi:hypothetical protein
MDDRRKVAMDALKVLHASRIEKARRKEAGEPASELSSPEAYFKALNRQPRRPGAELRFIG